jgi:hypothetical protein
MSNMPQCTDCGCDLPGLETLCSRCYDATYSEIGRSRSLLESMRRREGRRTIGNQDTAKARQPWWLVLCWAIGGLGFAWDCAFELFSGRYSFCSEPVLRKMGVIVVLCSAVSLLAVFLVRSARLRDAAAVFFLASSQVWFYLTVSWVVHR